MFDHFQDRIKNFIFWIYLRGKKGSLRKAYLYHSQNSQKDWLYKDSSTNFVVIINTLQKFF